MRNIINKILQHASRGIAAFRGVELRLCWSPVGAEVFLVIGARRVGIRLHLFIPPKSALLACLLFALPET